MIEPISALAIVIALLGVLIAGGQWYTARQKLTLELFDKRYAALEAVYAAIQRMRSIGATVHGYHEVDDAVRNMRFLVSAETHRSLKRLSDLAFEWNSAEVRLQGLSQRSQLKAGEHEDAVANLLAVQKSLDAEVRSLHQLLVPYLRMDQKLPRTPMRWLIDAWHNRPDGTERHLR